MKIAKNKRFFSELIFNYNFSMFLNKSIYEGPKFSKVSLTTILPKKFKKLFILNLLFIIFFTGELPYFFNIKKFSRKYLMRRISYFILVNDLTRFRFWFIDFFYSFYLPNFSKLFSCFGKVSYFVGKISIGINLSLYFNFFFFFFLEQFLLRFAANISYSNRSILYLYFFFELSKKKISKKNLFSTFFLLSGLKVPVVF